MNLFDIAAILLTASAVGTFVNHKWIKLPSSIGLLLLAMLLAFIGIVLQRLGFISNYYVSVFLSHIDFKETVFHGMLSFLLFAGALQINMDDLRKMRLPIAITSIISTLVSTFLIGTVFYYLANALGFTSITWLYALMFGAILSPTDPVATMSIVRKKNIAKRLETTIIGESLFNDGIAIVIFLTILELLNPKSSTDISSTIILLVQEIGGGISFGILLGWMAYRMLRSIDSFHIELVITLALATGGYALAEKLSLSAPLTMVVAGIIVGNHGRSTSTMSEHSRRNLDAFWEAIDEILNSLLFFLIGLEMIVINPTYMIAWLGAACIPIALLSRFISLIVPLKILHPLLLRKPGSIAILTWGGLRGALSIAMVLSLSEQSIKEIMLPCIYFVVVFSIAIQGLTLSKVLKKYYPQVA